MEICLVSQFDQLYCYNTTFIQNILVKSVWVTSKALCSSKGQGMDDKKVICHHPPQKFCNITIYVNGQIEVKSIIMFHKCTDIFAIAIIIFVFLGYYLLFIIAVNSLHSDVLLCDLCELVCFVTQLF